MKALLVAAIALSTAAPLPALARSAPADEAYRKLARCAAIETLVARDGPLASRLREENRNRTREARWEAAEIERLLFLSYDNGGGKQRRALKSELESSCRNLVDGAGKPVQAASLP